MSILIKGMEMPKKGEYHMTLYVDSDIAYIDVESFPEDKDKFEVIQVPPHGRLIDADALKKKVLMWLPNDPCGQEGKEFPFETDICVSMLMEIEEAEPIIEAEE